MSPRFMILACLAAPFAALCGCPSDSDPPADDDDSADPPADDDDSAGDDDSAEPALQGVEISVPLGAPDAAVIRLEEGGTTVLDWTPVAPGDSYTVELPIGWYALGWESAGLAGTAQVEVCKAAVTEAVVPASPGAVFDCP